MKYFWYFVLFIIVLATGLWMIILALWLFYWMCRGIYGLYKIIKPNSPYERPRPLVFDGKIEDGVKMSPIQLENAQEAYDPKVSIIDEPIENYVERGQPLGDYILEQKIKGGDVMAIHKMEEKENLIEYLSRFKAKDIASSPACGMRIMKEFSDMPFPERVAFSLGYSGYGFVRSYGPPCRAKFNRIWRLLCGFKQLNADEFLIRNEAA